MQTELEVKREKKLGRIPEIRIEESLEIALSRRANFEGRTLSNYVAHVLRLHAFGVVGTANIEEDEKGNQ